MAEEIKIHGLEGVRKALKQLPKEVRNRELQKALRPGANVIRNTARALAPRGEGFFRRIRGKSWAHYSGTLANSIVVRAEKKKFNRDAARLRVGVLHNNRDVNVGAWYWRFVEFGTSKMPAKPFMVPAFEISKYTANKLIQTALLKGVQRQAKRVRSK
jgi:HK97 gp10 family phage protein